MIALGGTRVRSPDRPVRAALMALLVAVGLALAPAAAPPVAAATGRLLTTAAASYALDLAGNAVHVSVAVTLRNDKPNDADFSYYWRDLSWAVQPGATNIRVRDSAGALSVNPTPADGYIDAQFRLRRDLLYGQSVKLSISWDLVGGGPRSNSAIRIGQAFAAFDLWAWGDAGTASVTASLPGGFTVQTYGSDVKTTTRSNGVTVAASAIADPIDFWVTVTATRESALTADPVTPAPGISLVVKSWPEDTAWQSKVTTTLRQGLPELQDLIGVPWPVKQPVEINEVYTPLLEGYAGFYYTEQDRIDISEDLDPLVIVHEGSHAWFNDRLFTDRWIDEGLADTYAAITLDAIGQAVDGPEVPRTGAPGHLDLLDWGAPERVTTETQAREEYAYNAAWYVVNELYGEIGTAGMQAVFRAATDDTIAYLGSGEPEHVAASDDWRRFLDLLEEVGGSTRAERLFRDFVVTPQADNKMDERANARRAYAALVADGDGWLPPLYIRSPMGSWSFSQARGRIDAATDLLAKRDRIDAAAATIGLVPGNALETAYESATTGFDAAESLADDELAALDELARASDAVHANADLVTAIGLLGAEPPTTAYDAAAAAFGAGDLGAAEAGATAALAVMADAPRVGRERLLIGVGVVATAMLLALGALLRGRRRRRLLAVQRSELLADDVSIAPVSTATPAADALWAAAEDMPAAAAADVPTGAADEAPVADPDAPVAGADGEAVDADPSGAGAWPPLH